MDWTLAGLVELELAACIIGYFFQESSFKFDNMTILSDDHEPPRLLSFVL